MGRGYLVARGDVHGLADAYVQRNVPLLRHLVLTTITTNATRENFRSLARRGGKRGKTERLTSACEAVR